MNVRPLTDSEREILMQNGCSAEDWRKIQVASGFLADRVQHAFFSGSVTLGGNSGSILVNGIERSCGIYQARLHDCHIGTDVLIQNVGSALINYRVGDKVLIENVFLMQADQGAAFGQGVEVSVLCESGGREVVLFDELTAQIAYLQAMYRHDDTLQQELAGLISKRVSSNQMTRGEIGRGAHIRHCGRISNVIVGAGAALVGAQELVNGTILSDDQDPAFIGSGASLRDFVVAEGAHVDSGATLEKVYVGQAARVGKGFSAENVLLFANCEAFNGEANAVFAGPYSVTHHKSTLLIGSLFSFYNAGSGSNQSNHMYKLGPVHQGIFERGCKTGSFSYVMLESHVPAFSTVIGKHLSNIHLPDLPFSYFSEKAGVSHLTPAINLFSIGTRRDESKWPARDRRNAKRKRDLISFEVFSPYTAEKMRRGRKELLKHYEETPREKSHIVLGGSHVNRLLLRKSAKYYGYAINRWLIGKVLDRVEAATTSANIWQGVVEQLSGTSDLQHPDEWLDLAGLLAPKERITGLMKSVSDGTCESISDLQSRLAAMQRHYGDDEWAYVCHACHEEYGAPPHEMSAEQLRQLIDAWEAAANSLAVLTLDDAEKEFAEFSQIGFGLGFGEEERDKDFIAVRGSAESNRVVQQMREEKEQIGRRADTLRVLMSSL